MALETGNYIIDLVVTNPAATDQKRTIDDHFRLIKTALRNCFAGFTGAVVVSGADTGILNAPTLTPAQALPAYVTGMMVVLRPAFTNTSTVTLNISALGVKNVKDVAGGDLGAGDLVAGSAYLLWYDGTNFRVVSGPTKNYVDNLSFSSALPAMAGNAGKWITTVDGISASWADPGVNMALSGVPTAPTAAVDTNTTQVATTAFVIAQAYSKLASPTFTGTPVCPTPTVDNVTSQIINAAWYIGQVGTATPAMDGSATAGTSKKWAPIDHVHPTDTSRAPLASPALTGTPTVPTAAVGTNTTQAASTAFVVAEIADQAKDVQVFTADGTWTKPSNGGTLARIIAIGGGGGGGSGRRGAASTWRRGGNGGSGGAYREMFCYLSALGATETVTVGAGGAGAAGVAVDSTNGEIGSTGVYTTFGAHLTAQGGPGGVGGTNSSSNSVATDDAYNLPNFAGPNLGEGGLSGASAIGEGGGHGGVFEGHGPGGGGAGGGISSGNSSFQGGYGGSGNALGKAYAGSSTEGVAGTSAPANLPVGGGGGQGGSIAAGVQDGSNGGNYGAGGGGGGGTTNGTTSGAGGDGGDGIVMVIVY